MMKEKNKFIDGVVALFVVAAVLLFSSCKTIKEVPVEVVKYKTEYLDRLQHDSIFERDSVYIKEAGDTIWEYRDKYYYRYEYIHDTTFICRVDTFTKLVEVEKELSKWQNIKMDFGGGALSLLALLVALGVAYGIKKMI